MLGQFNLVSDNVKNRVSLPIPFSIIVAQGTVFIVANVLLLVGTLVFGPWIAEYEFSTLKLSLVGALIGEPVVYQKLAQRGPNTFINTAINKFFNAGIAFFLGDYVLTFTMLGAGVCTLFSFVSPVKEIVPQKSRPIPLAKSIQAGVFILIIQGVAVASRQIQHDRSVLGLFASHLAIWGPLLSTAIYIPVERKWLSLGFSAAFSLPFVAYTAMTLPSTREAVFLGYTSVVSNAAAGFLGGLWHIYAQKLSIEL